MGEWREVRIGDFLHRVKLAVQLQDDVDYMLVTVRMHHNGVVLRELKQGKLIGSNMYRVKSGQFILSGIDARHGAFGVVPEELDGAIVTNDFWYFDVDENVVSRDFFLWLTTTPLFLDACIKSSEGTTNRRRLQGDKFFNFSFHFPEIGEQQRLAKRFNSLDVAYASSMNEFEQQSKYLKLLRQTVLQDAIEGKLTTEWRTQHPVVKGDPHFDAEALLNNIRLQRSHWIEKAKARGNTEATVIERKTSKLPAIVPKIDRLPDTWKNVFLIDSVNLVVDCHNKTAPYSQSGIKILRTTNIRDRKIDTNQTNFVTEATYHKWSKRCYPMPGDIIFTREAPVGEAGIIPEGEHVCMGQRQMLIRTFNELISNEFLLYALTSSGFLDRIQHTLKGAFVKHLRVGDVENAAIPLPPLAEQHVIVARVNSLMAIIDELDKQVAERKEQAQLLMQTVLREAFDGGV